MSQYYRDKAHLFEIYGYFLDQVLQDDKIGPKMAKAGIIIKFIYTDPDCEITIDLKNPPAKAGYHGTFYLGPCDLKEDVWSKQSADHSHRFWHGLENPVAAVTRGKVKQGGKITAMLKLLPVVKPTFVRFPQVLREMGYDDLVVTRKPGVIGAALAHFGGRAAKAAPGAKSYDRLYINGEWTAPAGTETIPVVNPCNEAVIAHVAAGTAADVDRAVRAARAAFPAWSATSPAQRGEILTRLSQALAARQDEIGDTIAREMGMPATWSRMIQAGLPIATCDSFAEIVQTYAFEGAMGTTQILKEAIGVCGFITPWNYPLHQIMGKVAPALAAGCTMVLKPSRLAPLNAFLLAEILDQTGLPAGVFNLVCGPGATVGQAICAHPDIDMVSITGSTASGIRVAQAAAETVKRVTLELGGKSANILLEDADFQTAVAKGVHDCFLNTGQTCSALSRMLVPAGRQQEAAAIARQTVAGLVMGDAFADGAYLGPLVDAAQRQSVVAYIEKGLAEGATLVTGGPEPPAGFDKGFFVQPTVFADVSAAMTIAREEIFGPVLCIMPYRSEDEAVAIANATPYGLSGAVWSADVARARQVARRMRTGQVFINGAGLDIHAPFGGYRQSGNGRERSAYGLEEFLEIKAVMGYND